VSYDDGKNRTAAPDRGSTATGAAGNQLIHWIAQAWRVVAS
jgi:hypothetical protein